MARLNRRLARLQLVRRRRLRRLVHRDALVVSRLARRRARLRLVRGWRVFGLRRVHRLSWGRVLLRVVLLRRGRVGVRGRRRRLVRHGRPCRVFGHRPHACWLLEMGLWLRGKLVLGALLRLVPAHCQLWDGPLQQGLRRRRVFWPRGRPVRFSRLGPRRLWSFRACS